MMTTNDMTEKNPWTYFDLKTKCAALHALANELAEKVSKNDNTVPDDVSFRALRRRANQQYEEMGSLLSAITV